ncbi:MAG: FG-GAP-like repeat-containing protein [Dokdonella sp.]
MALITAMFVPTFAHALAVSSTSPVLNAGNVARATTIVINFDRPLATASIGNASFRVFGQQHGKIAGATVFSNANQTLTFTPAVTLFPGELVTVNLSHAVTAADSTTLRSAGYAFQFLTHAGIAPMTFIQIDAVSVRTNGNPTVLYGGAHADFNLDGWIDYAAVNEVSADLRVMLNRADGSGLLGPVLVPPPVIGFEASPNDSADFNNDGKIDIATSNTSSDTVSVLLGLGTGRFGPQQAVAVGMTPHGIAALDVDGDADPDLVVASENGNFLSVLINDGSGVFGNRTDFDSGGNGEYALSSGDMNGDGILDLVVGTYNNNRLIVLTGNGNGTFTSAANIDGGGKVWKLVLGDVNGDGKLDVASVNGPTNNGAIAFGNGNGTLQAAALTAFGGTTVASDLGDLDGDGDLDWVVSSYGAARWYIRRNNGSGVFSAAGEIMAPAAASCASLYDADNDGDLDMSLADENADLLLLMRNGNDTIFKNGFN